MSKTNNPYHPPQQSSQPPVAPVTGGVPSAPCPNCKHTFAKPASFTWWGGALGPWMFSHCYCASCGSGFNSKTGNSNNTAIAIYVGMGVVIGLIIGVAMALNEWN